MYFKSGLGYPKYVRDFRMWGSVLTLFTVKNFKTRCEGLAPGLFLFAILGNATYSLSIVVVSTERSYLIRNASWLAGMESLVVFATYAHARCRQRADNLS